MDEKLERKRKLLFKTNKVLEDLEARRSILLGEISDLEGKQSPRKNAAPDYGAQNTVDNSSSQEDKIRLFRSLFRGREDIFARRFESKRTGRHGWQPACRNEWAAGRCDKFRVRCDACPNRELLPVTDGVIESHLRGSDSAERSNREFVAGVYPMRTDEACFFLAVDFDKQGWKEHVREFLETCRRFEVPAAVERSRSGNGGHVWIIFSEPVPARLARRLGAFLLSRTLERRPEIGLDSYDRLFPSQDTLPRGGFGSLIALPLQKKPREEGNTVFLDEEFNPHPDQWAFLSTIRRMSRKDIERILEVQGKTDELGGIRMPVLDETAEHPWDAPPSGVAPDSPIPGPFPGKLDLVLGDQLYIPKVGLNPALRNRLVRIAAFQNPDFYQSQAMRLSTYGKPRIISTCEEKPDYLCLPRGCLEETVDLLQSLGIDAPMDDKRFSGIPLEVQFDGKLFPEQKKAAETMLASETGVLSASTAFGKTVVAAYLISRRKVNTLVIVHRRQLLDQWTRTLGEFLSIEKKDIGQIGGGKKQASGKIDVAMVQSLYRKGAVDDLVAGYGHVIVDECHHISAVSFEQVVRRCKAKYFTGLSATVARKDGHHPIIFMQCGPVRFHVSDKSQLSKRPFTHSVVVRPTYFRLPPYVSAASLLPIQEVYDLLFKDDRRNRIIAEDVTRAAGEGRFPILLTERVEHLERIQALLEGKIPNVFVLRGGMGKKQRKDLFDHMNALSPDESRVLLATGRYIGEGFDDDRLDTLFLALPISWRGTLTQYAGRLHRFHESKRNVLIYDYVDFGVPVLANMFRKRRTGYKKIGYEIIDPGKEQTPGQIPLPDMRPEDSSVEQADENPDH